MRQYLFLPILLLCCFFFQTNSQAQTLADEKKFVATLQAQLQEQYQLYRNRDVPICDLRFSVEKTESYLVESAMGSLTRNEHRAECALVIDLIVGDLEKGDITTGTSAPRIIHLPMDYSTLALRQILTREVQWVYAEAEKKQKERKLAEQLGTKPSRLYLSPSYDQESTEPSATAVEDFSAKECIPKLNTCTEIWNTYETGASGRATLLYTLTHQHTLTSGGLPQTRHHNSALLTLEASITDKENNILTFEKNILANHPNELPETPSIIQMEISLYEELVKTVETPVAEPGFHPVLFSNEAAALLLYQVYKQTCPEPHALLKIRDNDAYFTISSTSPYSDAELVQQLRQTARQQHKEYGYWVKTLCFSEREGLVPQEVYRIFADGRTDEQVHGLAIGGTPTAIWNSIIACGKDNDCNIAPPALTHKYPVSCSAPAVLCYQVETRNALTAAKPVILSPAVSNNSHNQELQFSSLASRVMQDEIQHFFEDSLLVAEPKPYNLEMLMTDATTYSVRSTTGSVIFSEEKPVRSVCTRVLVGNDGFNNENLNTPTLAKDYPLPLDNNYNNAIRSLHNAVNDSYRQALMDYRKKDGLPYDPNIANKNRLKDRSDIYCRSSFEDTPNSDCSINQLQDWATSLSAAFTQNNAPMQELCNSGVDVYLYQAKAYFESAQNVQYAKPFRLCCVVLYAEAKAEDGELLRDEKRLLYRDFSELPDPSILQDEALHMAERLALLKKAPKVTEYYDGPVIISGEAVATIFAQTLLEGTPSLVADRMPADKDKASFNYWETLKNKSVMHLSLSVRARYDINRFENIPLLGYLEVDAEGVPVDKSTDLIVNGKLENLLSNRIPTNTNRFSNGHQQLALENLRLVPTRGAGVLELSCRHALDDKALEKELLKEARAAGEKYVYQIVSCPRRHTAGSNASIIAYRIKVSNGEKTLVRIQQTEQLSADIWQRVCSSSSDKTAHNILVNSQIKSTNKDCSPLTGIPTSLILPAQILIKSLKIIP